MKYILALLLSCIIGFAKGKTSEFTQFVPNGYVIVEQQFGDLNNDGRKDCVLIIKGTDKSKIIIDEYQGKLDRNRRGIIILFNQKGKYVMTSQNLDCFSSEHEDGGVYYAPELSIEIKKKQLIIHYAHGRYGYTDYIFSYRNNDIVLIGFEQNDSNGPITVRETSINFLTKKKIERENINADNPDAKEVFSTRKLAITVKRLQTLSTITNFDEFDMSEY